MWTVIQLLTALEPSKWMAIYPLDVSRRTKFDLLARRLAQLDEERHMSLLLIVRARDHWMLAVLRA